MAGSQKIITECKINELHKYKTVSEEGNGELKEENTKQ